MDDTSKTSPVPERDIHYYRQRYKNRVFEHLVSFFAEEAQRRGISKRDLAERLRKDPAQITRWLSSPTNLTLDTISDLLLALDAEMDHCVVRFLDRTKPNEMHPLAARASGYTEPPSRPRVTLLRSGRSAQANPLPPSGSTLTNRVLVRP